LNSAPQRVLYVSYDGVLEPLGQSQVVAYLEKLAPGREIHLITFEKAKDLHDYSHRNAQAARLIAAGITWHPQPWRNRPRIVSAAWNLIVGSVVALQIAVSRKIELFHARNILCSAMCLPAVLVRRGKLISDIRGFWPDERADGGLIRPGGIVHKALKAIERLALRRSSAIVTLTEASVPILKSDPRFGLPAAPITVIPTCVDLQRFRPPTREPEAGPFILGYVGSFGTWYMLDETVALFAALLNREPEARFVIANRNDHEVIRSALGRNAVPSCSVQLVSARYAQIPDIIGRMDAGVCFVRPQFSKISSAPTKFAEYLACGVPVVATEGVGDMAGIIRKGRVGLVVSRFDAEELDAIAGRLMELRADRNIPERCRAVAQERFSLEAGVSHYRAIYEGLTASRER
jgi:glycosyltransferase involved in cell wall biosynthesis